MSNRAAQLRRQLETLEANARGGPKGWTPTTANRDLRIRQVRNELKQLGASNE